MLPLRCRAGLIEKSYDGSSFFSLAPNDYVHCGTSGLVSVHLACEPHSLVRVETGPSPSLTQRGPTLPGLRETGAIVLAGAVHLRQFTANCLSTPRTHAPPLRELAKPFVLPWLRCLARALPANRPDSHGVLPLPEQPLRCALPRGSRGSRKAFLMRVSAPNTRGIPVARQNLLVRAPSSGDGFTVHDLTIS